MTKILDSNVNDGPCIHSLKFIVPQLIQLMYISMQDLVPPDAINVTLCGWRSDH